MTTVTNAIASAPDAPTPFAMCRAAFAAAKGAYEGHRDACRPASSDEHEAQCAYEHSYQPLVDAMHEAGIAAVRCPVSSVAELGDKLEIFKAEDMANYEGVDDLLAVLVADARRLGGVS